MNTCVGFHNQRYFILACFYMTVATTGGIVFGLLFILIGLYPFMEIHQFFLPVTIIDWLDGVMPIEVVFIVSNLYTLPLTAGICYGTLYWEIQSLLTGKTDYELQKKLKLKNSFSTLNNIKTVFGKYWYVSWILPCNCAYKQFGDPTNWPNMSIEYERKKIMKKSKKKERKLKMD